MMTTMSTDRSPRVYVPSADQPTLARFTVAAAKQGKRPSDVIGDAMRLWLWAQSHPTPRASRQGRLHRPAPLPGVVMRIVNKAALVEAIGKLHERADAAGWPEAERLAEALGWTHPTEMPDGNWIRSAIYHELREVR